MSADAQLGLNFCFLCAQKEEETIKKGKNSSEKEKVITGKMKTIQPFVPLPKLHHLNHILPRCQFPLSVCPFILPLLLLLSSQAPSSEPGALTFRLFSKLLR